MNEAPTFAVAAGESAISSSDSDWSGYNVGINRGKVAGQTINYPHVHLILRKAGDTQIQLVVSEM